MKSPRIILRMADLLAWPPNMDISSDEERFVTFGISPGGRLLAIAHTDRDDTIRIISARPATSSERRIYEEI